MSKNNKKKQKGKNYSKQASWKNFEKHVDRLFNWAYVDNINRYDRKKSKKNEIPNHLITKEKTKKGYASQVKQYCKWVFSTKGETNLRYYKKSWYEEYLKEKFTEENLPNVSVSSIYTQIAALTKFENILEAKWKKDKGELIQFGIIADKRVRESLKESNIYRNIEDMKKSRPIWDIKTFEAIENELSGEYKKLWRFLGITGLRLESALLMQKKDIFEGHIHIEHGKAGKRSEIYLLNPELITQKPLDNKNYFYEINSYIHKLQFEYENHKNERRLFDNFKKEVIKNGQKMNVNKKLSTIKTDFEKAVRDAALGLNISNITPHSARKFYCNSVYSAMLNLEENEVDLYLISKKEKYESTFRKELNRINSKRKYPRNFDQKTGNTIPLEDFRKVLSYFTREEKSTLISSLASSHHRISIMAFYIDRNVKRKSIGKNKWN